MLLVLLSAFLASDTAWGQQQCPLIQASELEGASGLIARSFVSGELQDEPIIQLFEYRIVCLASGSARGTYRLTSVIANYSCDGLLCPGGSAGNVFSQFEFECVDGQWTFSQLEVSSRTDAPDVIGSLSTDLRRDCSLCITPEAGQVVGANNVDNETHCARKQANNYLQLTL